MPETTPQQRRAGIRAPVPQPCGGGARMRCALAALAVALLTAAAVPAAAAAPAEAASAAEAATAAPAVSAAATAEAALRDGLPSIAGDAADAALLEAATPAESEAAFTLKAAAQERILAPDAMLAWINAVSNAPANPADYYRARALSALGRSGEALPLLDALRARLPADSVLAQPALRDHAYALAANGDPAGAAAVLREAESAVGGDRATITLDLAHLLLSTGRDPEAVELLQPLSADTNNPSAAASASILLARAYNSAGAVSNAVLVLASVPAANESISRDIRATALAASALLQAETAPDDAAGETKALDLSRQALALAADPDTVEECEGTHLRLLARYGHAEPAIELARRLIAAHPRSTRTAEALRAAAALALDHGSLTNALDLAELHLSSIAANPATEASLQALRARCFALLDRHPEAAIAYLRVAELSAADDPARASALYQAANQQRLGGFYRQAAETLERLQSAKAPDSLRAAAQLLSAECLVPLDPERAIRAFLAIPTEFPDTPEAASALFRAAQMTAHGAYPAAAETASGDADENARLRTAIDLFTRAAALDDRIAGTPLAHPAAADGADAATAAAATAAHGATPLPQPEAHTGTPVRRPAGDPEAQEAFAIQASSALSVAILQQRLGDFAAALDALDLAVAMPNAGPVAEQAAALRPQTLVALGRPAEALAAYNAFTNAYPASTWMPHARFWRAARAFNDGEFRLATRLFFAFADDYPADALAEWALHHAAIAAFRSNQFGESVRAAARLVTEFPQSENLPAARYIQAEADCQLLAFDEAALLFGQVASDPRASPELVLRSTLRRGDCLFTLAGDNPERYRESVDAYRAALRHPLRDRLGVSLECHYKIGRSLEKLNRIEEARNLYYSAVILPYEKAPTAEHAVWYARAVFAAVDILRRQNAYDQANALLRRLADSSLPAAAEASRYLSLESSASPVHP